MVSALVEICLPAPRFQSSRAAFRSFTICWGVQAGYGEFQVFHDRGERADMYRQYLQPVLRSQQF